MTMQLFNTLMEKHKKLNEMNIHTWILLWVSEITNTVEYREFYAPSYIEGEQWLNTVIKFYKYNKIPYAAYENRDFKCSDGNIEAIVEIFR